MYEENHRYSYCTDFGILTATPFALAQGNQTAVQEEQVYEAPTAEKFVKSKYENRKFKRADINSVEYYVFVHNIPWEEDQEIAKDSNYLKYFRFE
ncbi:hypothetical protein [Paenibacillus plantiphilus]|nr:hypothetical protein [Paenibacillus plantiphilus]